MKRENLRRDERESETTSPPAPPAVVPGSLEWASAVGNQAVARLAAEQTQAPEEESAPVEEEEQAPEEEDPVVAALADVDEEQLPEQ